MEIEVDALAGVALEESTVNRDGEISQSLPPRVFFTREGDEADRDVVEHVFAERAYDVELAPGGVANANRLAAAYEQIRADGKRPLIIDAGAMIGATAVFYQLTFPGSVVVAIEPEHSNFALLQKNCRGLDVRAIRGAVASTSTSLFLSDPGNGRFGFQTQESGIYEVKAFPVNEIIADFGSSEFQPFICKINIEGGEAELFSQNVEWLDRFAAVTIELHDWMIPGRALSRSFLKAIGSRNFDLTFRGFEAFCLNNDVLCGPATSAALVLGKLEARSEIALGHIDNVMVTGLGDGSRDSARPLVLPKGSRLNIEGWAADPRACRAGSALVVSTRSLNGDHLAEYGSRREDVATAFAGNSALLQTGFDITIEASTLPQGRHELELRLVDAGGEGYFILAERLEIIVQ